MIRHGYCPTCGSFSAHASYIPPDAEMGEREKTDEEIARLVHETISHEPGLDWRAVQVTVLNSIVTLTGHVKTKRQKQRVAELVLGLDDVIDVFSHLALVKSQPQV